MGTRSEVVFVVGKAPYDSSVYPPSIQSPLDPNEISLKTSFLALVQLKSVLYHVTFIEQDVFSFWFT